MDKQQTNENKPSSNRVGEEETPSTGESLPASPTFDIETIESGLEQEPVSTHNFCQVGPGDDA